MNAFAVTQIIMKHRNFNEGTCVAFIDFEKAFDRVDRNLLWQVPEKRGYPQRLIRAIQDLYNGTRIAIKNNCNITQQVSVNQDVKQGRCV